MNAPTKILIERDIDYISEWSFENEKIIHTSAIKGAKILLENVQEEKAVIIEFFEDKNDIFPFADISLERVDIQESLTLALEFFVETEEYELAQETKNLQDIMNKNINA